MNIFTSFCVDFGTWWIPLPLFILPPPLPTAGGSPLDVEVVNAGLVTLWTQNQYMLQKKFMHTATVNISYK